MRAISMAFVAAWGILAGLFFAGMFIMVGHPVKPMEHAMWGLYALFFSSMSCVGMGRFLDETRFGKILAIIAATTIACIYLARVVGWLPVT